MPTYLYKAREDNGNLIRGTMEAPTQDALAKQLHTLGYVPTYIQEASKENAFNKSGGNFKKIKNLEMIFFSIQLANMLEAGVPILTSLKTLNKQIKNAGFKKVIHAVSEMIASGTSLSESMAKFPRVFSALFINMVKSGEVSGTLSPTLNRYAIYIEHEEDIRQKIKNAIFYPTILLFVSVAVIIIIISFVIPKFMEIFTRANVNIPLPTLILHYLGVGIRKYWFFLILSMALIVGAIKLYIETKQGKAHFDDFKLKIPIIGPLIYKTVIARFCRTLATLLKSGVSMLYALSITRDTIGNVVMAKVVNDTRKSVEAGATVTEPLVKSGRFPPDVTQMIAVGEQTGRLHDMLDKIADFYDKSIDHSIRRLLTLIEPVLIIIMGGLAGFIMASMLLPLFDMVKTIQR